VSDKNSSRSLSKSLSINSNHIDTILWYLRIRKIDDKNGELLHQINGSKGSYIDISTFFIDEMKKLISELCEKVKFLDVKDGIDINFENKDENVNINKTTECFKFFFKDVLSFFGKDVQYNNIFIM
jgi:hypothetical protein